MKKMVRGLVISCIGVVVLVSVFIVLKLTEVPADTGEDNSDTGESIDSGEQAVVFYNTAAETVEKITIKNSGGEYTVMRTDGDTWGIPENKDVPTSSSILSMLTSSAMTLTAERTVETDVQDMSQYGLINPAAEVKVEFNDGSEAVEFLIGGEVPSSAEYYLVLKGGNDVYTVNTSVVNSYFKTNLDFVNKVLTPAFDTENPQTINYMNIERNDMEKPITVEYTGDETDENVSRMSFYKMVSPAVVDLDSSRSATVMESIFSLTAVSAAIISPAESDFEQTGISDPQMVLTVNVDGLTYKLTVGNTADMETGNVYGYFDGIDAVFIFNTNSLPWLTCTPGEIVSRIPVLPYIYSVKYVEVTLGEDVYRLNIEGDIDNDLFTCDGIELNPDLFKKYYQFMISAIGEELYYEPVNGDMTAQIRYVYIDEAARADDVVAFYEAEDRKNAVVVNGEPIYRVRKIYVTKLISNLEKLLAGEEIDTNW